MGKRIYLLRHGETEWNAAGRYQGALDSALTERGRSEVEAMARRLSSAVTGPHIAHVSLLGRTRETASLVARHLPLALRDEPRLAEVSLGSWNGLTEYEIDMEFPLARRGTTAFDWYFRAPDGESFEAARARVAAWLDEVDGTVIAISHGLLGRIVRGTFMGLSERATLELPLVREAVWELIEEPTRSMRELSARETRQRNRERLSDT